MALYDDRICDNSLDNVQGPFCIFDGQRGGVTQIKFSSDGQFLFTGGRKVRTFPSFLFTLHSRKFEQCSALPELQIYARKQQFNHLLLYFQDANILIWDVRNFKSVYFFLERTVDTNQRIYFDTTPSEDVLMSGGTSGYVNIWNMKHCLSQYSKECQNSENDGGDKEEEPKQVRKEEKVLPICTFKAGSDCINGTR